MKKKLFTDRALALREGKAVLKRNRTNEDAFLLRFRSKTDGSNLYILVYSHTDADKLEANPPRGLEYANDLVLG